MNDAHFRALERMYHAAPINKLFPPTIRVSAGSAEISMTVEPQHLHSMGILHGSVYFKLLDDSAAFAAASIHEAQPIVTAQFTINFKQPVTSGEIRAVANVVKVDGKKIYVEASLFDSADNIVADGSGLFLPTKTPLADISAYQL